ncbi:MAG: hypothetical protein U1E05_21920, partial [Patescibacteria group bacterium]|nr:hypothetical protein [Patescibacteria group bacterium]
MKRSDLPHLHLTASRCAQPVLATLSMRALSMRALSMLAVAMLAVCTPAISAAADAATPQRLSVVVMDGKPVVSSHGTAAGVWFFAESEAVQLAL